MLSLNGKEAEMSLLPMNEITSPDNSKREMKDKFELYQAQKVKEYWIVSP